MQNIPMYDQNGQIVQPQQAQGGYWEPPAPGPNASARVQMPNVPDMGGRTPGVPAWYRMAFFPTSPYYSTNPGVGYQPRFYSGGLLSGDADYNQGTEALRLVQFNEPCRLIANNGGAIDQITPALLIDQGRNAFLFRQEFTTGDRLHITQRLGGQVLGSGAEPGEIGGTGYTISGTSSVTLGITPLFANLRIDVTLVCLEMRGARNFTPGG